MTHNTAPENGHAYPWMDLLRPWSREWIDVESRDEDGIIPPDAIARDWLGRSGASNEEITDLERRIGTALPPSYRQFLAATNGWLNTSPFINDLLGSENVGWWRDLDPTICAIWSGADERSDEHWLECCASSTLKISGDGDAAVLLLNPHVMTADGEWEAWFLASWVPGERRFPSFWELMKNEYESFRDLKV